MFVLGPGLEALQCHGDGIGTTVQGVVVPGDHLGVVADAHPVGLFGQARLQGGGRLGIGGLGVRVVAHLDHPRQILTRGEAGIHSGFTGGRIGIRLIFLFQLRPPGVQVVQDRLLFGQPRLMLRDDALTRGQLLLQTWQSLPPAGHLLLQSGGFRRRKRVF